MMNGYEDWNPAEKAAREAQEKALAATRAAEEEHAFIDQGAGGGFVAPPSGVMGGLLTGNGGTGVTGNGTKSDAPVLAQGPLYRGAKREDIPTGLPTVITGNGNGTNGQQTNITGEIPGVQNGKAVPTIPTIPTTPQPEAMGQGFGGIPSGQNIMGAGNQGYTGGQGFVPQGDSSIEENLKDDSEAQAAFKAGREQQQAQSESAAAAGQPIPQQPTTKRPLPSAPTNIAMSSEQDLSDDDFRNVWDRVNRNAIPMAQLGNFLKFETTDVVVGTDANGDPITARETRMSTRSKLLLERAISVERDNRIQEQDKYERDLAEAELTGNFDNKLTLEGRKAKLQKELAEAKVTGMYGEKATLAKQKLDLEERIDYANSTGMYKDPNTNKYEKTLLLKKMEQDKELADLEMQMQETALMGANPEGVVTFAKEQWLDQIKTDKTRYNDAVTQLGVENDMRMLEILGTSTEGAFVYDENGNIETDLQGNPILQTLAAKQLAEDMLTGQANRDDIKARTDELKRSNEEAEKLRLMEIMGYDENEAKTFAARQFDEKVRVAKKAEELRETELELERTMLESQMDLQRQQLASQNLALMLQNPAAFGALQAMQGGMMPQQLGGLGLQMPTTQQPAQISPQQQVGQFFQGGIPTMGQLGQLDPQALQTLTNMLGFAGGITPQQFGRASAGVTPGGMQAGPARVFAGGMPTARRV